MIGTVIKDQYRVLELLGEGGMGIVFKALDLELERLVALKVLKAELGSNSLLIQRFRDELRTLAGFNHPNIATLFTSLTWEGSPVMVMELVEGQTLSDMVAGRGPIPSQVCVPLIKQALAGVSLAHRRKIIHRDIKPANLMLNTDGVVKVMDFGIAKIQNAPGLTRSNAGIGTSYYMAPEQIRGAADVSSDIYAMGVTLYELLAGQVPFRGASQYDIEHAHISEIPRPPTEFYPYIPSSIVDAVMRSLEKDPAARFQTADEFSAALSDGAVFATSSSMDVNVSETYRMNGATTPTTSISGLDGAGDTKSPHRALSSMSPGEEALADASTKLHSTWPGESTGTMADTFASSKPEKKKKLILAGSAFAALTVLGGVVYGIYSILNPLVSPIVINKTGESGMASKDVAPHGSTRGTGGDTHSPSGSSSKPPEAPRIGGGSGSEPVFALPKRAAPVNVASNTAPHVPVIQANDALSGRWAGHYQNLCSNTGSTQVKMVLGRNADESITGSVNFAGQGGLGGKCSLVGKFHPKEGSLTLTPSICEGTVPIYFQGSHMSALMFTGNQMSGSVNPEDNATCVQVSLAKTN